MSTGLDDMVSYHMGTGGKVKGAFIPGIMNLNCAARVPLESEQIAWIVAEHLWILQDVIRSWGFYDIGNNITISAVSPAGSVIQGDSADEWVNTVVFSPYKFIRTSSITPLTHNVLQSIKVGLDYLSSGQAAYTFNDKVGYHDTNVKTRIGGDLPVIGGRVANNGTTTLAKHSVRTMAHPFNPDCTVITQEVLRSTSRYSTADFVGAQIQNSDTQVTKI
jgi:hypothetical protein